MVTIKVITLSGRYKQIDGSFSPEQREVKMSLSISPMIPSTNQVETFNAQSETIKNTPEETHAADVTEQPEFKSNRENPLIKAVDSLLSYRKINDKKSLKAVSHLKESLEKATSKAVSVEKDTAEQEIKMGGLRRVGKDLKKLFKGMGLPPQLAKDLSRGITQAMRSEDVDQINFSLTTSRAATIEMTQTQTAYSETGDGSLKASSQASQLMMTAVQVRSFDFSINLQTGEFSLSHSRADLLNISSSQTETALLLPVEAASANTELSQDVAEVNEKEDIVATFRENSTLFSIRKEVQSSFLMEMLRTDTPGEETEEEEAGLEDMQQLTDQVEEVIPAPEPLFATLTRIRNLRIEQESHHRFLRFSADAIAPMGLKASDELGNYLTLYPREDGALAKLEETPLEVTV